MYSYSCRPMITPPSRIYIKENNTGQAVWNRCLPADELDSGTRIAFLQWPASNMSGDGEKKRHTVSPVIKGFSGSIGGVAEVRASCTQTSCFVHVTASREFEFSSRCSQGCSKPCIMCCSKHNEYAHACRHARSSQWMLSRRVSN